MVRHRCVADDDGKQRHQQQPTRHTIQSNSRHVTPRSIDRSINQSIHRQAQKHTTCMQIGRASARGIGDGSKPLSVWKQGLAEPPSGKQEKPKPSEWGTELLLWDMHPPCVFFAACLLGHTTIWLGDTKQRPIQSNSTSFQSPPPNFAARGGSMIGRAQPASHGFRHAICVSPSSALNKINSSSIWARGEEASARSHQPVLVSQANRFSPGLWSVDVQPTTTLI